MTVLLVGYPIVRAGTGSVRRQTEATTAGAAGARSAAPREAKGVTLFHGGSAESAHHRPCIVSSNRLTSRVGAVGPGFYLGKRLRPRLTLSRRAPRCLYGRVVPMPGRLMDPRGAERGGWARLDEPCGTLGDNLAD